MSGPKQNRVVPALRELLDSEAAAHVPESTISRLNEMLGECWRQDSKWGQQNHRPVEWFAILGEEFGEVAKEVVGIHFAHPYSTNYRVELIQTAAVAIRMVESYDRWVALQRAPETSPANWNEHRLPEDV